MSKRLYIELGKTPNRPILMQANIIALRELGENSSWDRIDSKIAENEEITESELSIPEGKTSFRFAKNCAWARTALHHFDLIEQGASGKKWWSLGRNHNDLSELLDFEKLYRRYMNEVRR